MFKNIQMLRALAAFMVFCFHAVPQYRAMDGGWNAFERLASLGFAGVDVFFVISGFVAALSTLNKDRTGANAGEFLRRRVLRIYFGYWPMFGLALLVYAGSSAVSVSKLDLMGSFFLTNLDMSRLVLYVSWSLTYELIFYIVMAATFAMSVRKVIWCVHLAAVLLIGFLYFKLGDPLSPVQIFLAFFLEFIFGAILFIHRKALRSRRWIPLCILGAFIAYWTGGAQMATDGAIRIFTFGIAGFFLVTLAVVFEQSRTWITGRYLVELGDSSYTLYLVHLVLLALFATYLRGMFEGQAGFVRELGFFSFLAFSVWISRLLYVRLELPLYAWALGALKVRRAPSLG